MRFIYDFLENIFRHLVADGYPCLFRAVAKIYCPGCGGTRAVYLLLTGHPVLSFLYHPIVLYTVFACVYIGVRFAIDALIPPVGRKPFRLGGDNYFAGCGCGVRWRFCLSTGASKISFCWHCTLICWHFPGADLLLPSALPAPALGRCFLCPSPLPCRCAPRSPHTDATPLPPRPSPNRRHISRPCSSPCAWRPALLRPSPA